jgi:hypothetical protein
MSLTMEQKAELFDYLASRASEIKMQLSFGGSDWVYNDRRDPEQLAAQLYQCQEWESGSDEDEDDEEE